MFVSDQRSGDTKPGDNQPMVFEHVTAAQRVVFGSDKAGEFLAAELERLGSTRPMVITGGSAEQAAREITSRLEPGLWWDEVIQHIPVELAEKARAAASDAAVDALVTVGGGSTIGLGKAIALTSGLPLIAVPTTYAGSEATDTWGLTENRTKTTGLDPTVLPVTVIYDAALSRSLPVALSVASGLNGMAHCVDSLWAPRADPINRTFALEGARALAVALRGITADPDDLRAREMALYGCYLAALSFASAGSGMHHKIAHVLGGTFNLPHAQVHATVLPYVLAFNAPAVPEASARLADALGSDSGDATEALNALYREIGAPRALADIGFTEDGISEAVERSLNAIPDSTPTAPTEENLTVLLRAALAGEDPATVFAATEQA